MGVVRKQSILSSLFTYIGFAIGAVNILLLFPRYFTAEEIGLTRILLDVSLLCATLCTLGTVPMVLKFYPVYHRYLPQKKNDLPVLSLVLVALGIVFFIASMPVLKPWILRKFGSRSPLFVDYFDLIYPFTITLTLFSVLEAYAWSVRKTVLSNVLKEFGFRLLTTVLIGIFIAGLLTYKGFITAFAWIFLPPVIILLIVLNRENALPIHFQLSSVSRRLYSKMFTFAGFLFSASILNVIARTNDTIILASQSTGGLSDAAVFTIATYLVTVMEVPQRSLVSIATPFIAEAWQRRDISTIDRLYKKTALHLMMAGLAIFGVILLNLDTIQSWLGTEYAAISGIVLVAGLAKLIDLSTGVNTQILLLSKYWRLDFTTNILLVLLSIPLNYLLTKHFNVMGPAYGNLISLFVFNFIRFLYIWKIFHIQPFTLNTLKIVGVFMLALISVSMIVPDWDNPILTFLMQSAFFLAVFTISIIKLRISKDIEEMMDTIRSRVKRLF